MIFRNEVSDSETYSVEPMLNQERKTRYQNHVEKIMEISAKNFKPLKANARQIDDLLSTKTKLKQFTRLFNDKQKGIQRKRSDKAMMEHIIEIQKSKSFYVKKNLDSNSTKIGRFRDRHGDKFIQGKTLGNKLSWEQKQQNKRLIKCITQNSLNPHKFRETLRENDKKYSKLKQHMRKLKNKDSSKIHLKNDTLPHQKLVNLSSKQIKTLYEKNQIFTSSFTKIERTEVSLKKQKLIPLNDKPSFRAQSINTKDNNSDISGQYKRGVKSKQQEVIENCEDSPKIS